MVWLIAKRAVLYQGRQYEPGEPLPAYDTVMVDAWLTAISTASSTPGCAPAPPKW